ncbi:MAG: hypothetical protein LUG21_05010, partial [Clostridiales bacterium]|nr:hypothetical protein [Clostridiales bacterium]
MDKIAVNGFFNEELIKKKYKSQNAEIDFNVSLAENKQKYDYDAVFFTGSFDEKAAYSWLGNEHL